MNSEAIRSLLLLPSVNVGVRVPASQAAAPAVELPARPNHPAAVVDPAMQMQAAKEAAAEIARLLAEKDSELTIDFDESLGRAVFKLVNTATGEIVRQIPTPEMLAIAHALAAESKSGVWLRTDA